MIVLDLSFLAANHIHGHFVFTPGKLKLMTRSGRIDKSVDAHVGAVTDVKWSKDGSALATGVSSLV
jgi:hypothetical protein